MSLSAEAKILQSDLNKILSQAGRQYKVLKVLFMVGRGTTKNVGHCVMVITDRCFDDTRVARLSCARHNMT